MKPPPGRMEGMREDPPRHGSAGTRADDGVTERRASTVPRRRVLIGLALLLPALALFVVAAVLTSPDETSQTAGWGRPEGEGASEEIDSVAPAFELPALDGGGRIALADYAGKVVVLNFWASWCAPCKQEAPELQALWEEYRDEPVQFLGVDHQDNRGAALEHERRFGISYPSAFDPDGKLAPRYGLFGLPATLVIGPDGRISHKFTGRIDAGRLREAIDEVAAA